MKSLLHLAARGAIQSKGERQEYDERKVKEGKNKRSVLKAIRNKVVFGVFAVIGSNQKYDKNYTYTLI